MSVVAGNGSRVRRVDVLAFVARAHRELVDSAVASILPPPDGCYPVEHATPIEGDDRRRVRCVRLRECLAYADRLKWPGFSCQRCAVKSEVPQGTPEEREDMHGIVDLWEAVSGTRESRLERIRERITRAHNRRALS